MISVITPVYNGEKFIESCLKIVVDQNCSDIEHIIMDGGSKDKTVEIIKEYALKYSHIRWISEPDQGQSDAMNKGISLAKGEIIAILNVDDYYQPNVLNRVAELFNSLAEPTFLVGNCKVLDDSNKVKFINKPTKLKLEDLLLGWEINPHPINPSAYFYHKSLHDKIGLYNIEDHYTMDVDFIYRAVQSAQIKYVDEIWGNYRDIEGTKTFNDRESGQGDKRLNNLMQRYEKTLPKISQINIKTKRYILSKIWSRVRYYQKYPHEILPSLRKIVKL